MNKLTIEKYCTVVNNTCFVNGMPIYHDKEAADLSAFAKSAYRHTNLSYNKFFKMDDISKLGFIAAEILLSGVDLSKYNKEEIAVIFSNSHSTLITDKKHQQTIDDYNNFFPSPKVFVYTLPNIMIGEISIRHKLRGENTFFIVEKFNEELIVNHINSLFLTHKSKAFLGGWINLKENDYEAFLFLASSNGNIPFNAFELNRIYNIIS
jgi:hypothetical protein